MTVGQLLEAVSSRELTEWMAYYSMEPFGEERSDLRAGIVASTVANTARDPKRRREPFKPEEFMPQLDGARRRQQSWQQMLQAVEVANAAMGGRDER